MNLKQTTCLSVPSWIKGCYLAYNRGNLYNDTNKDISIWVIEDNPYPEFYKTDSDNKRVIFELYIFLVDRE